MQISVTERRLKLRRSFAISRGSRTEARVIVVTIRQDGAEGNGECVPYARYGESVASVAAAIDGLPPAFDRGRLQELLPPGAARNAVDCALWDLEAKLTGLPVWKRASLEAPGKLATAYTISLASSEEMKADAASHSGWPLLKVKLGNGGEDLERLRAVREGAGEARLIIDANEGWDRDQFGQIMQSLPGLDVEMVEQPFPAGDDEALSGYSGPVGICADESCHDRGSLDRLADGYTVVNIKLDKTGGLTEALALRKEARERGYRVMVGCMIGSSLAMAPAVLLAQGAELVDLDGPVFLAEDHDPPLRYDGHVVHPPGPELWG